VPFKKEISQAMARFDEGPMDYFFVFLVLIVVLLVAGYYPSTHWGKNKGEKR
jgi:hypothetical protein